MAEGKLEKIDYFHIRQASTDASCMSFAVCLFLGGGSYTFAAI